MKEYELVIEHRQPHCGGKSTFVHEITEVATDDPMAYVAAKEKGATLEMREYNGKIEIVCVRDKEPVTYEFTEI